MEVAREQNLRLQGRVREALGYLLRDENGRTLTILALGWLVTLGMQFSISALLPQIKGDLGIDNSAAGVALSLMWFMHGLMQFPAGILSDWVGERRLLLVSLSLTVSSVLLFVCTFDYELFLVAVGLFGVSSGLYGTPLFSLLSKVFSERSAAVLGFTSAMGNVGAGVLPVLTNTVTVAAGWRYGFGVTIPFVAGITVCLWWFVCRPSRARTPSLPETPFSTVRLARTSLWSWTVGLMLGGIVSMTFIYQGVTAFLPTYLTTAKQLSQSTIGTLYGLFFFVGAAVQPSAGYVSDRFGLLVPLVVITTTTAGLLFALPFVGGVSVLAVLVPLLGVQMGFGPVCSSHLLSEFPDEVQGINYGFLRTVWFGIGAAAPFVVGILADRGRFDDAFLLFGVVACLAMVLFLLSNESMFRA